VGSVWIGLVGGTELVRGRSALTIDTAGIDEITAMGAEVGFGGKRLETEPYEISPASSTGIAITS